MDLSLGKKTATDKDISYLAIDMPSDPVLGGKMKRKTNTMRTISKIYLNYAHLGDFAELYAMQQFGNLEKLLKD